MLVASTVTATFLPDRAVHAEGTSAERARALELYRAGRFDEAEPLINQILSHHPRDIDLLNKRGNLYLRRNEPHRALADFEAASQFSPFLAQDAISLDRQFAPDVARNTALSQEWGPQFLPSVIHNRGIAHLMLGQDDQAMADFQQATQLRRSFRSWTGAGLATYRSGQAASLGGIGQVYLRKRNPEQALDAFNEALVWLPNEANALVGRGQALVELGRNAEALVEFDRALQAAPTHPRARSFRADALARLGRTDESLREFDTSFRAEPPSSEVRQRRAGHLARLGRLEEALRELDEALKLDPNNPAIHKDRGGIYGQMGEPARALEELNTALRLNPNLARAYQNRAATQNALGHYDQAIQDADNALRLEPRNPGALNNRGLARLALGQHDAAILDFTAALEIDPRLGPAYLNRAGALTLLGRHDDAAADYASAVRIDPRYATLSSQPGSIPDLLHLGAGKPNADRLALRQDVPAPASPVASFRTQGDLLRVAGDWEGAITSYTQALQADPRDANALVLRGWSRLIAGQAGATEDARAWFARSGAGWRDPLAPSVALLAVLAERRAGHNEAAERQLDEALANTPGTTWPAPVLRYLKRSLSSEDLLRAAATDDQQTLARAVLGLDLLQRGYTEAAMEHLEWARDRGADRSVARDLARETLARLPRTR
ncbi:MAG: tetratricopeptide repeat protein [Isosphaeraceae bacterium]